MKRVCSFSLLTVAALVLGAGPVWAWQLCPFGGGSAGALFGGSVQIRGTHYDTVGNATSVTCDTKAGDLIDVCTNCETPAHLDVFNLYSTAAACTAILTMIESFATVRVRGTDVPVVKNSVPKNACVFHGAVEYFDSALASYWAANTVRKFNSAGKPTIEKGSSTINSYDGQVFIGKIVIKYP